MSTTAIVLIVLFAVLTYFVSRDWRKVAQVVCGWGGYELFNFAFDFLFWSYVQYNYGLWGIVFLTFCALFMNFIILLWYQDQHCDWLGVGVVEEIKEKSHLWIEKAEKHHSRFVRAILYIPVKFFKLIVWALKKNDVLAFWILSIYQDSFVTTAFLLHGRFGKLQKRDYLIFVSSTIVSCAAWSVLIGVVVKLFEFITTLF